MDIRNVYYKILLSLVVICFSIISNAAATDGIYNIRDFGAKANGKDIDTKAIQMAIDKATQMGGGVVYFPPGIYLSGSVIIKDFVTLKFETGSILLGSTDMKDYPAELGLLEMAPDVFFAGPLIYAENAQYIGIEGRGIVNGQGTRENFVPLPPSNKRPGLVRFKNCKFVSVKDISLINSARWTFHLRECEDVSVSNINIDSRLTRNNDGIDVDGCTRVRITGCYITSGDDAIVLKSFKPEIVSDIVIADCILSSNCSAIKIGTETMGTFENISISNCVIFESRGINLFTVDGADINNVTISNMSMRDCKSVIQLRLGGRMRKYNVADNQLPKTPGSLKNILISNLQAINIQDNQDFISGVPGYNIENVVLKDINITYKGGGTKEQASREIPENIATYPKIGMFGDLPSYGFFIRHVNGIKLDNINLSYDEKDMRPAIVCDDVTNIEILHSEFEAEEDGEGYITLNKVHTAIIKENRPKNKIPVFLKIQQNSQEIISTGNYLKNVLKTMILDESILPGQVTEINNFR